MRAAGSTGGFTVAATEDLSMLSDATLSSYDIVMFALTSGELPLTAGQQAALVNFVAGGRGFIGVHSATDSLYSWPEYGRLIGAYFKEHPWTQQADVVVETQAHPATSRLGTRFSIREEFYTFQQNPRERSGITAARCRVSRRGRRLSARMGTFIWCGPRLLQCARTFFRNLG
jgi:type 1 glutamine amidotransferase